MFGIEVDSWEKLVSEFADMLDSSNMEAWPYVDLTDQRVGVHVDLNWGDPTCEEPLTGHELVEIEPKSSREGYEILAIPDGDPAAMAKEGVARYRAWLKSIGMPTTFAELGAKAEDVPRLAANLHLNGKTLGAFRPLTEADVRAILRG